MVAGVARGSPGVNSIHQYAHDAHSIHHFSSLHHQHDACRSSRGHTLLSLQRGRVQHNPGWLPVRDCARSLRQISLRCRPRRALRRNCQHPGEVRRRDDLQVRQV